MTDDDVTELGGMHFVNVHKPDSCRNEFCVMHNPSDHHMRTWVMHWRSDRALMERICAHGIGHPDPDDLAFHISIGNTWQSVHGCDGCCREPERPATPRLGETTCRDTHADEWSAGRVNPCARCYLTEELNDYHNREKQ